MSVSSHEELSWGALMSQMGKPFEPFSVSLWMTILVVFSFVGIALDYECQSPDQASRISYWDFFCSRAPIASLKGLLMYTTGDVSSCVVRDSNHRRVGLECE